MTLTCSLLLKHWRLLWVSLSLAAFAPTAWADSDLKLPANMDWSRAQKLAKESPEKETSTRRLKVYVQMVGISDQTNVKLLMPAELAQAAGSNRQLNEWFRSSVAETERFTVFDEASTGVQSESSIVVEGLVISALQTLEDYAGVRKASSSFRLALKVKDAETGEQLKSRTVVAEYGLHPREGHAISASKSLADPQVRGWLEADFKKGLEELMNNVAAYIERAYRPVARVSDASKEEVLLNAGDMQGIKGGDAMIVFRVQAEADGTLNLNKLKKVVAAVRCDSVGNRQSQCQVVKRGDAWPIKVGDFAATADDSLKLADK